MFKNSKVIVLMFALVLIAGISSSTVSKQAALAPADNSTNATVPVANATNTTDNTTSLADNSSSLVNVAPSNNSDVAATIVSNTTNATNATVAAAAPVAPACQVVNCSCLNASDPNATASGYCPDGTANCYQNNTSLCGLVNGVCKFTYNTSLTTCLNNNSFCTVTGCDEKECVTNNGIVSNVTCPSPAANFTQCYSRATCGVDAKGACDFTPELPLYMCLSSYGYFDYVTKESANLNNEFEGNSTASNVTVNSTNGQPIAVVNNVTTSTTQ